MVPTLNIDREILKKNGFLNGYIKDARKDVQYENCIYLLFKPEDIDNFKDFLDGEYERTRSIIDDYDYENGYVVLVYELNKKFSKDFEHVRTGKYSKTSKEFQSMFPKTVRVGSGGYAKEEISLQYRIFNHTEDLVQFWENKLDVQFDDDQELWHAFIEENETLNLDKIKEYV
jgi:hypothetical protein